MQEKNHSFSQFSQRTEKLAAKQGVLLKDLPQKLGISERMLYGYRSGKYPITAKAWRKLEEAERAAGIVGDGEEEKPPAVEAKSAEPSGGQVAGQEFEQRLEAVLERLLPRYGERLAQEVVRRLQEGAALGEAAPRFPGDAAVAQYVAVQDALARGEPVSAQEQEQARQIGPQVRAWLEEVGRLRQELCSMREDVGEMKKALGEMRAAQKKKR